MKQPVCPKCRTNIIGRATDMENFLKVNFIKIESSRAKKIFKSQKNIQELKKYSRAKKISGALLTSKCTGALSRLHWHFKACLAI